MARNIYNPEAVDEFLHDFVEESDDPRLGDYLVIALKNAILKENKFCLTAFSYPEDAPEWLTQDKFAQGEFYAFEPDLTTHSHDTFRHIKDWISGALNENDAWVNDLDNKGRPKQLGHCIGNGAYDKKVADTDRYQYYSLRGPNNKAHATLEVENGTLKQCKGKENAPPRSDYFAPIQDFIKENKWKLTESAGQTGLLEKDGEYYEITNLPDNFVYEGGIKIIDAKWLKALPNGLGVSSLYLYECPNLTKIGSNLSAYGRYGISIYECERLQEIGDGARSETGSIVIEKC